MLSEKNIQHSVLQSDYSDGDSGFRNTQHGLQLPWYVETQYFGTCQQRRLLTGHVLPSILQCNSEVVYLKFGWNLTISCADFI